MVIKGKWLACTGIHTGTCIFMSLLMAILSACSVVMLRRTLHRHRSLRHLLVTFDWLATVCISRLHIAGT